MVITDTKTSANMREYLMVNYPYEYYMYVDLDIKKWLEGLYIEKMAITMEAVI